MGDAVLFVGPLERVVYLKTLPGLADLEPRQLAAVAQHARERRFSRGDALLAAGQRAEAFYVVVDGRVSLRRPGRPLGHAGPGEQVGFVEQLARVEPGLDALAETPTLALEFDAAAHLDVCEEHFPVVQAHLRYLAASTVRALRRLPDGTRLNRAERQAPPPERPLNTVERILTLRRSSALSSGSVEALAELAGLASELRRPAGAVLWRRGDAARSFLLLASGSVECRTPWGRRLRYEGSSLALGQSESLLGVPRWNDTVSREEVVALELPVEALLDALEAHFDLARDLLRAMARGLLGLRERRRQEVERP
jgi:CRP-like cAMP-binding protein